MKIIVTGSEGNIGRLVCEKLKIHNIVRFSKSLGLNVQNRLEVSRAMEGADFVIHLAAAKRGRSALDIVSTNVLGSINVLKEASERQIPVKLISSIEALLAWHKPYGTSKYLMEQLGLEFASRTNVNILRLPTVWGSEESIVTKWISLARNDQDINVFLFPYQPKKKFFITIDEAAQACASTEMKTSGCIDCSYAKVVDCLILARAIVKFIGKGRIKEVTSHGVPYEMMDEQLSSANIDSITLEETIDIIKSL